MVQEKIKKRNLNLDDLAKYFGIKKKEIINKVKKGEVKLKGEGQDLYCPVEELDQLVSAFVSPAEISRITKKMLDEHGSLFKRLS